MQTIIHLNYQRNPTMVKMQTILKVMFPLAELDTACVFAGMVHL